MAESDDPAEAAERLERALDRIAALAAFHPVAGDSSAHASEDAIGETDAEVSRRLDALIGRIRAALGPQAGG